MLHWRVTFRVGTTSAFDFYMFYDTALAAIGRVNLASSEADALISKAHQRELLVPPGDVPTRQHWLTDSNIEELSL